MSIHILSLHNQAQAKALMQSIGVDSGGIKIMAPKTIVRLARINKLPIFAANILKQEALSIGADTAVSRDALTGKIKFTDCLIMANLAQYKLLCEKLKFQPYGLSRVADELRDALSNYQRDDFVLDLGSFTLNLNTHTHIMGIVNVTPDSFSADGLYQMADGRWQMADVVSYAQKLSDDGADILDIGGESSRPGAKAVSLKEELERVIPAIKRIRKKVKIPISVDTYKAEVAHQALDNGANIINDITSLCGDSKMAKIIKHYNCGLVLMHMKGRPRDMQRNPRYDDLMDEIINYLHKAIDTAQDAGIDFEKIIVDPGIGFGKMLVHNLKIIQCLSQLKVLGRPILAGTSRKSFIGKITRMPVTERLAGSLSSGLLSVINGVRILRVHDVRETKQALLVLEAVAKCH